MSEHPSRREEQPIKISLVIPAWNEEKYITPTLESVSRARERFEGVTGERVEVIVVDNASTDRTAEIARSFGCKVVPFEKHQMAAVRNTGAREACGDFLAFVDADRSIVPEDVFLEIASNLSDEKIFGGGSAFRPEKWNVRIFIAVAIVRVACRLLGIGCMLYYMRRADFEALGGWNEKMYAAEDVELSLHMKKAARASGRKLRNLRNKMTFCVRKLDMLPPLKTAWDTLRLLIRGDFSKQEDVAKFYYDVDNLR